jgi:hypothetical protein
MVLEVDYQYCRAGCGKAVMNRSGYCINCRMKDCRRCRKQFKAPDKTQKVCQPCQNELAYNARRLGEG